MDRFQLISNLTNYSVTVPDHEESGTLRILLQKTLAEEILKTEIENKSQYLNIVTIANSQLHYAYLDKGYLCTYSG